MAASAKLPYRRRKPVTDCDLIALIDFLPPRHMPYASVISCECLLFPRKACPHPVQSSSDQPGFRESLEFFSFFFFLGGGGSFFQPHEREFKNLSGVTRPFGHLGCVEFASHRKSFSAEVCPKASPPIQKPLHTAEKRLGLETPIHVTQIPRTSWRERTLLLPPTPLGNRTSHASAVGAGHRLVSDGRPTDRADRGSGNIPGQPGCPNAWSMEDSPRWCHPCLHRLKSCCRGKSHSRESAVSPVIHGKTTPSCDAKCQAALLLPTLPSQQVASAPWNGQKVAREGFFLSFFSFLFFSCALLVRPSQLGCICAGGPGSLQWGGVSTRVGYIRFALVIRAYLMPVE
ncbi:hypothetical protein LY76DRAFT_308823 [Colletotrichum caudatum]|nr:hypothetical protein LY76DRAFT_308823 [Colletotrichum caudatum]